MSTLNVNSIVDEPGTGSPDFPNGASVNGNPLPTAGSLSNRNLIINGAMQIWQRGTSSPTDGYLADRWNALNVTTASRQTDAPSGFQYSIEVGNSSASFPLIAQRIEAANVKHLSGQTITVSFWAKSISGTASLFAEFLTPSAVDNFATITNRGNYSWATPATSWVKYTYSLANVNAEVLNGFEVRLGLQNQSAGTVRITGVQLEVGDTATPFEHRSYGQELALCERYFALAPVAGAFIANGTTAADAPIAYPVQMRANATITARGIITVTDSVSADYAQSSAGITSVFSAGTSSAYMRFGNFTGLTGGNVYLARHDDMFVNVSAEL